jgi:GNAT superfamily N-acetyltransferase
VARNYTNQIVGSADVTVQDMEGIRHVAYLRIGVQPDHRRAGIGRALLGGAVAVAERFGRSLLMDVTHETVPAGEEFARRIGAGVAQVLIENRLDLRAVDRDQVRSWAADGPSRAPGYHLEFVAGITPDQLLPGAVAMMEAILNTQPLDNLEIGDRTLTPERFRQDERAEEAAGIDRWAYYAVEDATGDLIGLSDIFIGSAGPERVDIGQTVVKAAHRGHGLSNWLKAAMMQKVFDELPDAHWLVTNNSASNDTMLTINRKFGFQPSGTATTWQVSVERARAYLSGERPS